MHVGKLVLTSLLRSNADWPPTCWHSEERWGELPPHYLSIPDLHKSNQPAWVCANLGGSLQSAHTQMVAATFLSLLLATLIVICSLSNMLYGLAFPVVSWEEITSLTCPPWWLSILWPLGYSEQGGGHCTAVLVRTSCLVKWPKVREWHFPEVQGHWPLLNCHWSSTKEQPTLCFKPSPEGWLSETSMPQFLYLVKQLSVYWLFAVTDGR